MHRLLSSSKSCCCWRSYHPNRSHMPITFSFQDINLTSFPHTDAMVIIVHINRWDVKRILIDNGSQVKILFLETFDKMGLDRKQLKEPSKPLYGFSRKRIEPVRAITLLVYFGTCPAKRIEPATSFTKWQKKK
jgi:hypothetical protein